MSQGDGEDPEVQGGADVAGDRRGGVDPGGSRGTGWSMQTRRSQGEGAGGTRGARELVDCRATAERRELGAMVEPTGQRAEADSGAQRLEAESRDTPTMAKLEDGSSHRIDGGLRRGGRAGICEPPGFRTDKSGKGALSELTLRCGTVTAPYSAHPQHTWSKNTTKTGPRGVTTCVL